MDLRSGGMGGGKIEARNYQPPKGLRLRIIRSDSDGVHDTGAAVSTGGDGTSALPSVEPIEKPVYTYVPPETKTGHEFDLTPIATPPSADTHRPLAGGHDLRAGHSTVRKPPTG